MLSTVKFAHNHNLSFEKKIVDKTLFLNIDNIYISMLASENLLINIPDYFYNFDIVMENGKIDIDIYYDMEIFNRIKIYS